MLPKCCQTTTNVYKCKFSCHYTLVHAVDEKSNGLVGHAYNLRNPHNPYIHLSMIYCHLEF